jgi:4'-phosphopantetheinyl transferase
VDHLWSTLAEDERARARRFHFDRDRRRYVISRGLVRAIMARYLEQQPAEIAFAYSEHGKPYLLSRRLQFNVSHSHDLILLALTAEWDVGIDVEVRRTISDMDALASRYFAPDEAEALAALPDAERGAAFLQTWTRKEAYLKALGTGLAQPLTEFAVSVHRDAPARLLHVGGDREAAQQWQLRSLIPHPDYVAALAVRSQTLHLRCWDYDAPI